jgi:hypothetical protein
MLVLFNWIFLNGYRIWSLYKFKLVQLAVVTLPVMYHQCTYACSAVSEALYIISKPYIICAENKLYTVRALGNNVAKHYRRL